MSVDRLFPVQNISYKCLPLQISRGRSAEKMIELAAGGIFDIG
jgi:hypothetical protein